MNDADKTNPPSDPLFDGTSEIARLMREIDWSKTPWGASRDWPRSLRTAVRIMLTSRFSMWMLWGPSYTAVYNDAYRPTLGTKHPALGLPANVMWAEVWPEIVSRLEIVLEKGESTWDEALMLFLERSGYLEETYHTFSYSPIPDDEGGIGGMLCVVTEETDRVIGERRLALLRDLGARLAGTRTEAQVFAAVEGTLGPGTKDLPFSLGYLFEDGGQARLLSRSGFAAGHSEAPERVEPGSPSLWPLSEALASSEPVTLDLPPRPDGWPRGPWRVPPQRALVIPLAQQGQTRPAGAFIAGVNPYRAFDEPYRDFLRLFAGQIAAALANARAYEQERQRAEALADLDRAKTAFFSNVSHEFRTPLTLMLGPIGEMVSVSDGPVHDELALVHRNGLRLLKLVNTMLEFSRIEAGRVQASYEPTDLAELTADLASVFRSATDKAGLELRVDAPKLSQPVYVDRDMWEKIVFNLVSNAFKFTLQGSIEVGLREEGRTARLTVRDTGSGVPAHELPRLFERFHRVEGTRGRTHEGTGIGLALVQELVKLHGGAIEAASEVDKGTTFTVSLPLGKAHLPQDRIRTAQAHPAAARSGNAYVEEALRWLPQEAQAEGAPPPTEVPGRAHVLLADDNADMRDYIRRLLGDRWEVTAVANGREALQAVEARRPDLIITDVMMPILDGFGLLRELRADESAARIPVLMLSARAGEESRVEALEAGATDYLVKPFAARELLARVEALILRSRIRAIEDAQRQRLSEVFSQAPMAIALLRGPQHVYELANASYSEMVGDRPVVGKSIRVALPELEGQGIFEILDRVYESGQAFRGNALEITLQRHGRPERCAFDFVYQPMFDEGEVTGIAVVAFEVTALVQARHEAELASRAKDEFLAMLGHELRNPLAPILTALQLMRLRGTPGGEKERGVIERQVKHLVGMVDDLLDVSRVTRGKIELRKSRLELAEVVAQAIETASPLLEQHRHALTVEVPRAGLLVNADAARLAQAIANVLTNAAKYTPDGGRVQVAAQAEGSEVVLTVRDSGIGIAREMLPRIFEPFTQARQALDRSQGGLGLGLAIVRSLVTLHGGWVSAHSDGRDKGAEFAIHLPLAIGRVDAPSRPEPVQRRVPAGERVLVVDDNEDAAELLADMLAADDFSVRHALDGPSALAIAAEFQPDVAILDIGLPVMDGYELAARFRDHPRLSRTRLIALTGYGQPEDRARTAAAGFALHLVKPVDVDKLRAAIAATAPPARATS
jgi:signal transduction histidine kinase/DNA-binding response OmpR family regulator